MDTKIIVVDSNYIKNKISFILDLKGKIIL
jgi:hypothetical protein